MDCSSPFPVPPDRHSRSEIIQAQGQAVKHFHTLLPALFRESPTFCVFASLACQTRTLSELLMDKTSRSTGYPQRLLLFFVSTVLPTVITS